MIEYKSLYPTCVDPGNCYTQYLSHPNGSNSAIQMATFNSHRFAYYYWCKWQQKTGIAQDLVTFDWHQDLCYPEGIQKQDIKSLDPKNLAEVSYFCWARLNPNNDDHIMAAAYAGHIQDIWVVCKQGDDWEDEHIIDQFGANHTIRKFRTPEEMWQKLQDSRVEGAFLDIDLDYFTIENPSTNSNCISTHEPISFLMNHFNPKTPLMSWLLQRINGITIALEPGFMGGLSGSFKWMSALEEIWFYSNPEQSSNLKWKHLA